MDYQNPQFCNPSNTAIVMEVDHPVFGWQPFTAAKDGPEDYERRLFEAAKDAALPYVLPDITRAQVDNERDRRIDGGFTFGGIFYQSDAEARENIAGAAQLAFAAIVQGVEAGDLHWHGEPADFEWIAFDDTRIPMDAHTMFAFGQAALAHKRTHIFAANDLKKLDPIPADFIADQYWP